MSVSCLGRRPSTVRVGHFIVLAVAIVVLLCSSAAGAAGGSAAAATAEKPTTLVFDPVADARVEEANAGANFGAATRLATDGDAGLRVESYLRFQVAGVAGTVGSATLRLYVVSDGTVDGPTVAPAATDWDEAAVTWATRPGATGPAVADIGAVSAGSWVELDVTAAVGGNGPVAVQLRQTGLDGVQFYSRQGSYRPQLVVTWTGDPVVMAAGDIACKPAATVTASACRQRYTSDLLDDPQLAAVLPLGDTQYEDALLSEFLGEGAYDATWGRQKALSRPVPGNHEYHVAGAAGYFDYFGAAAGPAGGYYSYDIGAWHLIALNSEVATSAGSAQERWLRDDLAATAQACILAYSHRPRFSSGDHGNDTDLGALWEVLYGARADVVLSAHDHDYERFALQSPAAQPDPNGIREFVVGTGGASHSQFPGGKAEPNSEVRDATTFGVLKLTLHDLSYDWQFLPEAGSTFTDSGTTQCHEGPGPVLRVSPRFGPAPLGVVADASGGSPSDATPLSYTFDFGDGTPVVGPQPQPIASHVYTADGQYVVTVSVTDASGRTAAATDSVVVQSNLVRNPGFEVDTSGWNAGTSAGVTLSRVAGGHSGDWAAAIANGGAAPASCLLNDSPDTVRPSAAGTYTASLWVRADTAGATLRLRFREWSGSVLNGSAVALATLEPAWKKVVVTYTPAAPGASTLDLNAYIAGAPPGACFSADDASVTFDSAEAPPVASLSVAPAFGTVPHEVTADATRSTDVDKTPITSYRFDFGDGTTVGPQAEPLARHVYTTAGSYTVTVTVTDAAGLSSTATATVAVRPNLVANPGFEVDTSGWNAGTSAGVTLSRVAGGHGGDWAAAIANGGAAPASCVLNDSPDTVRPSAAGTYTASLWVRADTAGATLKLRFREWSGGALAGSAVAQTTLEPTWQQVAVTYAPVAPGASTLDLNAYIAGAPPGACFYADDALIFRD